MLISTPAGTVKPHRVRRLKWLIVEINKLKPDLVYK